jgi:hypothetical protein
LYLLIFFCHFGVCFIWMGVLKWKVSNLINLLFPEYLVNECFIIPKETSLHVNFLSSHWLRSVCQFSLSHGNLIDHPLFHSFTDIIFQFKFRLWLSDLLNRAIDSDIKVLDREGDQLNMHQNGRKILTNTKNVCNLIYYTSSISQFNTLKDNSNWNSGHSWHWTLT